MSTSLFLIPSPLLPLPPLLTRTHFPSPPTHTPRLLPLRRRRPRPFLKPLNFSLLNSGQFPDPDSLQTLIRRAEGILFTIADAAVSASDTVDNVTAAGTTTGSSKDSGDWLSGITYYMETILKVLKDGLSGLHVPNSYGFAIILLTVLVKAATFPLTKKQVESAMAVRSLQPQIKAIQQRYAGDQERIQLETARLYKLAGVNPLAGCLPTLATIPVWIGLYRALSNVANEGLLSEGFFWIPSLAGPTTIASRQNGTGISWLFPFIDGNPPLGWSDTLAYLVLPVLLIISQYVSIKIMQPSQANDPNMKGSQAITNILPLMIGYFALSVPSGLSLYWLTNNILSTGQQIWFQKMGGAKNPVQQINNDVLKAEEFQISQKQSSISESRTTIEKQQTSTGQLNSLSDFKSTKAVEKQSSTGLRPGERFKQLKEEETRRRREREEAKRKAEEAAKATQIAEAKATQFVEGTDYEASAVEAVNGSRVKEEDIEKDQLPSTPSSSSKNEFVVNGNGSAAATEDKAISVNVNSRTSSSDSSDDIAS